MKVSEHTKEKRKIKEANAMIKNLEESQRALLALQLRDYSSFEKYHKGELEKIEERISNQKTIRAQAKREK